VGSFPLGFCFTAARLNYLAAFFDYRDCTEEIIEFDLNVLKRIPDKIKTNVYSLMPYLPVSNLEKLISSEKIES